MAELDGVLAGMQKALDGAHLQAATAAAANVFLQAAQALVPVDSGAMRAHLQVVSRQGVRSASSSVQVADSAPAGAEHAAVFVEYGTVNMPARPFMRPAFESQKNAAAAAFETNLKNGFPQ